MPTNIHIKSMEEDVSLITEGLNVFKKVRFKGKKCVKKLKEKDYNWRQMEWWGFYF